MTRPSRILKLLLVALLAWAPVASLEANARPATVVEDFHNQLLATMKRAETETAQQRFEALSQAVDKAFDLERMIRVASGSQWGSADSVQRATLLSAFRRLSIATYASQFDGYSGERFEMVGNRPGPQGTVLVQTRIVSEDTNAGLTYVMKETDSRWLIADILLDDSVSQLAVRRSEYRRILADSGIDGLVNTLNRKADDLLAK
ncbi:MAG: ABC transporter substrate-binding protein [Rhodospirillales bacterium]|jgi:phospholipid transport system substrate-binding protein|nr:ABC transporter substrate-binding protein [Rhodospirillales bacterium]